uniref:Uncharacterized protein n=1 Tax=Arundo donax TaxID=35708 RepID=A0A0A9F5N2_ARUDO
MSLHAGHADAADDGRGHGGDVAGLGVEEVVQLGEKRGEEGEGGAGGEDALAQHRALGRALAEHGGVLCVVRVPDRPRQQAQLRDHERDPAHDEADTGVRPPPARRERAAAAEAAAGHHDHGLASEQQQQRADAVRRGRVGAVHAVGPPDLVDVHVGRAPAVLGADGEDESEDVEGEHDGDDDYGRHGTDRWRD